MTYSRPLTGFEALIGFNPDWVPRVPVLPNPDPTWAIRNARRKAYDKAHKAGEINNYKRPGEKDGTKG